MKYLAIIFIFIFSILTVKADDFNIFCPSEINNSEKESILNKITGLNLISKKTVETIIQKELEKELNSKIDVNLEIYNVKRLKQGEFKSIKLNGSNIKYKAFSMSDFRAETICPYNKVIYKNGRIYYPEDLAFRFKGIITNNDIQNITDSNEFNKKWDEIRFSSKILGSNNFIMNKPNIFLQSNKMNFNIEIGTPLITTKIKFKTGIKIEDNKIVLKNINEKFVTNILGDKIHSLITGLDTLNTKYCKIYITNAQIFDNIIKAEGIFIINKNYNGEK